MFNKRYLGLITELVKKDTRDSIIYFIEKYLTPNKKYTVDELNELVRLWELEMAEN